MKKLIVFITISLIIAASFTVLSANATPEKSDENLQIGISKLISHPALDAIEEGIKDYGEISTASSIAQLFKTKGKDLVVGIATPTAQALANVFTDIPVVFATVTDPKAAGLMGIENVAGTSDMVPVKEQLNLIERITGAKSIGMVYTSAESNGITLMETMRKACEEKGIELVTASVSNSAEVMMAAQSIIDRVDAMYVSTDNTVISAIASLSEVCSSNNVPLFSSDTTSSFGTEVLMAGGFDYYQSGRLTGEIIKRVLDGEKPEDIGTVYLDKLEIYINLDVAEKLGISIPDDIITDAVYIIENGSEITK